MGVPTLTKPEVLRLQQRLLELNYALPKYGADGYLGRETMAAVQAFQLDHDLPVSQTFDISAATIQAMFAAPLEGIDVSKYQGVIDWTKVAASKRFAYLRLSYSRSVDKFGAQNWDAAQAAGIVCGGYHFFRNSTPVAKQVDAFLRIFTGPRSHGPTVLPPALDLEWDKLGTPIKSPADRRAYIQAAKAWLEAVQARTDIAPIVYTGPSFWKEIGNPIELQDYGLWVADPGAAAKIPPPWSRYLFWQYSHTGQVEGIKGKTDLNVFRGTEEQFQKLTRSCKAP